jgi:hypothetical protein
MARRKLAFGAAAVLVPVLVRSGGPVARGRGMRVHLGGGHGPLRDRHHALWHYRGQVCRPHGQYPGPERRRRPGPQRLRIRRLHELPVGDAHLRSRRRPPDPEHILLHGWIIKHSGFESSCNTLSTVRFRAKGDHGEDPGQEPGGVRSLTIGRRAAVDTGGFGRRAWLRPGTDLVSIIGAVAAIITS